MTVEELANKRYSGEFVFMLGHLEGVTRFVFECFDPRPDHEGKNTYMVSYFDKGLCRRDVVDVPCYGRLRNELVCMFKMWLYR